MKKQIRLISISAIGSLVAFIIPFFITNRNDSLLSILSLSFSALSWFATFMTLIIAILLYKRFGLESSFIERQANKVLELVDILKGKVIRVKIAKSTYLLRTGNTEISYFQNIQNKKVLISFDDYFDSMDPLFIIGKSYWLPEEIKQNIKNLEFFLVDEIENPEDETFVRFDFGTKHEKNWGIPCPSITVEQYILNYNKLILSIENWLKKHSDIQINLKLHESAH